MWDQGGQPWPQWPLSQQQWMQSFQHQQDPDASPHGPGSGSGPGLPGQVDWAALAQAWIAHKETTGSEPNIQPNGPDIQGHEPPTQGNHGSFQSDSSFGRMWQPEWGMHGQPPPPPPPPPEQTWIPPGSAQMDVVNPSEEGNSTDSPEFSSEARRGVFPQNSHGYGAQPDSYAMAPMAINQFDYQHGAASSFGPPPSGFHPSYWQGPPQNRRDARPPGFRDRPRSPMQLPMKQEVPAPLDAVKRRTLPAWIREGLEKRDRENQKRLEQERMEKERAEMSKDDDRHHEVDDGVDGPRVPRKSKFDSDDEANEENEEKPPVKKEFFMRSPSPPAEDSEPEMTEEEKEFQLMVITKTILTEILLEVTNEEIQHISKEVHRKATRAPAKQLAQSSALASLTGLSGLGDYGSEESADEDDRSARGSESSDTDEEELRHRIREKLDAFYRKEREMQQLQEKHAQDALLAREDFVKERLIRERVEYDEGQSENYHKEEIKAREPELLVERRRSRSEIESSEVRHLGRGKERSGRSVSGSPNNGHSSSSPSSSSRSSSQSSSSSSTSSSHSSSRSSSPRRKRRRSRSSSHKARRRSRSGSSRRRSEKVRDRRRSSAEQRAGHHKKDNSDSRERRSRRSRSKSRERGRVRDRESRSRSRDKGREEDKDRKRSREHRDSSHSSKQKQKFSGKDEERKRDRSRSHEKDKKKKDRDKEREFERKKDKLRTKEKTTSSVNEENGKLKKRKEMDSHADSQADRYSRQDSKSSNKGSAKASKRLSNSDSSISPTPDHYKEKKSKKSKRSRSRSVEKSHKSGKKASRKHKSKSRSRSTSPNRHGRH
ncbi:arginine/serine-rich protein PNISR [Stigmatopora argus]